MFFTIILESVISALRQMWSNKLRTVLSLLGITIGIWCIIAVRSAIDSLEANIKSSLSKLGNNVVYVSKMPWGEDPNQNYWKYMRRPNPDYEDYEAIAERVNSADLTSYTLFNGFKNVSYRENSAQNVFMVGCSYNYAEMFAMEFEKGRFFSPVEYYNGADKILIGHTVAETIFPHGEDPIGKKIKLEGRYMEIVGVIKKSGKDLINLFNFDEATVVPYTASKKFISRINNFGGSVAVRAKAGIPLWRLKDDVTGVLRSARHLHPLEKDNFSLNTMSVVTGLFDSLFSVIDTAGLIIGIFSIIVGMFGVANIMFVSVKERTNQIGIKKSLGARNIFILSEFLTEAVVLCIMGGLLGLLFVWLAALAASAALDFHIFLSVKNIGMGILIAVITGLLAGIIPAVQASRMDPVEAIRK